VPVPSTPYEHSDVIQSIFNLNLRATREFVEGRQHALKIELPVDARHVPEAGYGNLAHGGNVIMGEAETSLLHPPPVSIVESYTHERESDSLRVTGSKGSLGLFTGDWVRLLVYRFPHIESLATLQRMRHNAAHHPPRGPTGSI
jgi:hypothetical protein